MREKPSKLYVLIIAGIIFSLPLVILPGCQQAQAQGGIVYRNSSSTSVQAASITTWTGAPATFGNSNTSIISHAVTMPSSGCPCRAFVSYSLYLNVGAAGQDAAFVADGTNNFATAQVNTTGAASGYGLNASSFSTGTYANGANVTFTLTAASTHAGSTTINAAVTPALTGAQAPWLNIAIFTSN
jgi:hypothetical protein